MSFFAYFTKAKPSAGIKLTELERESLDCFMLDEDSVNFIVEKAEDSKFYMYKSDKGKWLLIESPYGPIKGVSDV